MDKTKKIIIWLVQLISFAALGYSASFYNHVYTTSLEKNIPQKCIAQHNFMVSLIDRAKKCEENLDEFVELGEECGKALMECQQGESSDN
tara:strand:- start:612 stop:881 length:270 start_codon:yes stop_codon:yes gene_type:complete